MDGVTYYRANRALMMELLDELVGGLKLLPSDDPARVFGALINSLHRDPDRAVTIGAAAVMRLAEIQERAAKLGVKL